MVGEATSPLFILHAVRVCSLVDVQIGNKASEIS